MIISQPNNEYNNDNRTLFKEVADKKGITVTLTDNLNSKIQSLRIAEFDQFDINIPNNIKLPYVDPDTFEPVDGVGDTEVINNYINIFNTPVDENVKTHIIEALIDKIIENFGNIPPIYNITIMKGYNNNVISHHAMIRGEFGNLKDNKFATLNELGMWLDEQWKNYSKDDLNAKPASDYENSTGINKQFQEWLDQDENERTKHAIIHYLDRQVENTTTKIGEQIGTSITLSRFICDEYGNIA